ncbi:hypothetical protein BC831DRAFT_509967 [Entophlyctis helioformis]|nr:hypothetical protein BC831DRAFT_509967 [Entophlyctis helioformis]
MTRNASRPLRQRSNMDAANKNNNITTHPELLRLAVNHPELVPAADAAATAKTSAVAAAADAPTASKPNGPDDLYPAKIRELENHGTAADVARLHEIQHHSH